MLKLLREVTAYGSAARCPEAVIDPCLTALRSASAKIVWTRSAVHALETWTKGFTGSCEITHLRSQSLGATILESVLP